MKAFTSFETQIKKLKTRGLVIDDEEFVKDTLSRLNYYYITGYLHDYRIRISDEEISDNYIPGTKFEEIYNIILFDMKLRSILSYVLEIIENHFKARLGEYFAYTYGAEGYLNPDNFKSDKVHEGTMNKLKKQKEINKNIPFIKHHLKIKDEKIPIWVAIQIYNFGMLNYFYSNMKTKDRKNIAKLFDLKHEILQSWMENLNYLRNLVAHNMRLYNFKLQYTPKKSDNKMGSNFTVTNKVFDMIYICKYFISENTWNNDILIQIENLINEYSNYIKLNSIGFADDWKDILKI